MNKTQLRDTIIDAYAAHMRWFNAVNETDISPDIGKLYTLPRVHRDMVANDITLRMLRAQYDILNVLD